MGTNHRKKQQNLQEQKRYVTFRTDMYATFERKTGEKKKRAFEEQ